MSGHVIRVTAEYWETLRQGDVEEQRKTEDVVAQVVADASRSLLKDVSEKVAQLEERNRLLEAVGRSTLHNANNALAVLMLAVDQGMVGAEPSAGATEAWLDAELVPGFTRREIRSCLVRISDATARLRKVVDP